MKRFILPLIALASLFALTGCTTYSHNNNHYCASNTWNGTKCVSTRNNARVVNPVVVKQPVIVR